MGTSAHMHPSDQALRAYGLGVLDVPSAEAVNVHLEGCTDCRRRVAEVSADAFLGRLRHAQHGSDAPSPTASEVTTDTPARPLDEKNDVPRELAGHPQYRVIKELGRGGMGVVYLAHNKEMDRLEVLKILNQELLARRGALLDRFLREIRAAGKLNHPNVVHAYSTFEIGRLRVFAMEYVEGMNLADLVKARGPLPVVQACYFAYQAALGLQHAHEAGFIHRDIKPGNLILARQGQKVTVKVLDFGLAKALREAPVEGAKTQEGQALGTPDYNAPEQILNASRADIRADIYSLGCTLYFLLAGRPPFHGNGLYDIYQAHISTDARPLNLVRPEVPVELAAVVGKMMAKEPRRRYQTPAQAAEALRPFFKPGAAGATARVAAEAVAPPSPRVPTDLNPSPAASPAPPEVRWASLIDVAEPQSSGEKPSAAAQGAGKPPWRRPAAAAAGFGAVLLGIIITITIEKGRTRIQVSVPSPVEKTAAVATSPTPASPSLKTSRTGGSTSAPERSPRSEVVVEMITNSIGIKLALIPAGEFLMGSTDDDKDADPDEKPRHRVRISRPLYLGATEVTQGQYRAVAGENPSGFRGSDDLPVENVTWFEAVRFCNALSNKEGLRSFYRIEGEAVSVPDWEGPGYRLPTEAEWEYACRAGGTTRYSFGDAPGTLGEYAWLADNAENKTHPVGQKRSNAWGLYDMHGNVWEWCWDEYDARYYAQSPGADPSGPLHVSVRVNRGACWNRDPQFARSARRNKVILGNRYDKLGFRVARAQPDRDSASQVLRAVKLLTITGDDAGAHDWKGTSRGLTEILSGSCFDVTVTTTPVRDLADANLVRYDVLLVNYKDTAQGRGHEVVGGEQKGLPEGGPRRG